MLSQIQQQTESQMDLENECMKVKLIIHQGHQRVYG